MFDNVFTDSPKKYTKKSTNAKSNPQPKHIWEGRMKQVVANNRDKSESGKDFSFPVNLWNGKLGIQINILSF